MKKERQSQRKKSPNKQTVYERPDVAPFRIAMHGCEDELIECNEQKDTTANFRNRISNLNLLDPDLNQGVMRDIEERDDLTSESDLEMTDVQDMHMLNLH